MTNNVSEVRYRTQQGLQIWSVGYYSPSTGGLACGIHSWANLETGGLEKYAGGLSCWRFAVTWRYRKYLGDSEKVLGCRLFNTKTHG